MERKRILDELKLMYERMVERGDPAYYFDNEEKLDRLFGHLQSIESASYSSEELVVLHDLADLNERLQHILRTEMKLMKNKKRGSEIVARQYEMGTINESYFYDKRY